jgi:hypothetical protein
MIDEQTSILKLSHRWGFTVFYTAAVRELEPIVAVVKKMILGRACAIYKWLKAVFRGYPDTSGVARSRIGLKDVVKIARARKMMRERMQATTNREERTYIMDEVLGIGEQQAAPSHDGNEGRITDEGGITDKGGIKDAAGLKLESKPKTKAVSKTKAG